MGGPLTGMRVPRESCWRLQAAGSTEFRIFNYTGPAISATFGLIGWVTEATRSTLGVWPLFFLRFVVAALAVNPRPEWNQE